MRHVLVVEHEPTEQKFICQTLSEKYRVSIVETTEEALNFLLCQKTDLILLSNLGKEFVKKMRGILGANDIPVVFLISQGDTQSEIQAYRQGAVDIIYKPLYEETLLRRVDIQMRMKDCSSKALNFISAQEAISVGIAEPVEYRDIATGGHLKKTTVYFKILLEELLNHRDYKDAITQEDVDILLRAAPLHDIGKIGITDEVLQKASTLDRDEYEYIKTHTILGKEAFEKIINENGETRFLVLARDLAYCHHERWDGAGYPCGLFGEEIPLYARILTIADVYDALTSRRVYKEAYSHTNAVGIILKGRGKVFDPKLVDVFYSIKHRFEEALSSIDVVSNSAHR